MPIVAARGYHVEEHKVTNAASYILTIVGDRGAASAGAGGRGREG
uniref:Uncharacterized protein n=1 Tax=Phytophthora fragariae TaxID=53985 RepID=A0A6A3D8H4_9STRA|nr:hypothetical protein PF009_g31940 [Phytophthora fragariae]